MVVTDWQLREIYRKKAIKKGICPQDAEDVASEMYAIGLEKECASQRAFSRFHMNFKWLFFQACAEALYSVRLCKKTGKAVSRYKSVKLITGKQADKSIYNSSIQEYEDWIATLSYAVRENFTQAMKRYRVTCSGAEILLSGQELKELLGKEHSGDTDANFASNLKKRGKHMWLVGERLFRELKDACKELKVKNDYNLKKIYPVTRVKVWVL
jgi:hypothetical protein